MNFIYNFFKWTRKTTVVVLSFISLLLVGALVAGAYYLQDGKILAEFLQSLNQIIKDASSAGVEAPSFIITAQEWLTTAQPIIDSSAYWVYIGGIIFLCVFAGILLMSFITWLIYRSKNNKKN